MATQPPAPIAFKAPKPTPFTGEKRDSEAVENFLYQAGKYCRSSRIITDEDKLDVVSLLLSSRASTWFQQNEHSFGGDYSVFEAKFRANFIPPDERRTLIHRYKVMKQAKGVSVDEFAQEFRSVVDRLRNMEDEAVHYQFVEALQTEIQLELAANITQNESWDELVLKAVVAEGVARKKVNLEARKAHEAQRSEAARTSPASSSQNWRQPVTQKPSAITSAQSNLPAPMASSLPGPRTTTYNGGPRPPLTPEERTRLMNVSGCGYCREEYSSHFKQPCPVKARHEAAELQRSVQELNLMDFGSEMDNLESYPPIRPIILSAIINGVHIQGPADTGASANSIKDAVVAENNFQTRKSTTPSYVHQPLSNAPVKLYDELFANVSIRSSSIPSTRSSPLIHPRKAN
jgi:Retrotransposon gag protein